MRSMLSFLIFFVLAAPAFATDGVLEINQTCAVQTGCFPGDSPGFPLTIAQPGSYMLTGSLTVPDANTTAILVNADYVNLDLAGFEVKGPNACTGTPTVCNVIGSGRGIDAGASTGVTIQNGTVRGMGLDGILSGASSEVSNVSAEENGGTGLAIGAASSVSGCRVVRNATTGLYARSTNVRDNVIEANGGVGMVLDGPALVDGNIVRSNVYGIQANVGSAAFTNNVVTGNVNSGISSFGGDFSSASNNTILSNGCTAAGCSFFSGAIRYTGCNLVQTQPSVFKSCCPNPPNPDVCY